MLKKLIILQKYCDCDCDCHVTTIKHVCPADDVSIDDMHDFMVILALANDVSKIIVGSVQVSADSWRNVM